MLAEKKDSELMAHFDAIEQRRTTAYEQLSQIRNSGAPFALAEAKEFEQDTIASLNRELISMVKELKRRGYRGFPSIRSKQ